MMSSTMDLNKPIVEIGQRWLETASCGHTMSHVLCHFVMGPCAQLLKSNNEKSWEVEETTMDKHNLEVWIWVDWRFSSHVHLYFDVIRLQHFWPLFFPLRHRLLIGLSKRRGTLMFFVVGCPGSTSHPIWCRIYLDLCEILWIRIERYEDLTWCKDWVADIIITYM